MDWIFYLQTSIDYIEDNILEPINYDDIAKHIGFSNFHFHRVFSMLTGMTANEYIRYRKLSMAGEELSMSNVKIIDTALKYGYESPESFTKAFTRFHGFNPSKAKKSGTILRKFARLSIKIKVEGGVVMDYKIENKGEMKFLVASKSFPNEIIKEENNKDIADFWTESHKDGIIKSLLENSDNDDMYGLCLPVSKKSDTFLYGIGIRNDKISDTKIKDLKIWTVKPSLWAVFKCIGDDTSIEKTWERIFSEFLPSSPYEMLEEYDLEYYPENSEDDLFCEIWIPVKKK